MTIMDEIQRWDPQPVSSFRQLTGEAALAFAAMLDIDPPVPYLPPLWHWFEFAELVPPALGDDGYPRTGRLIPPIEAPQRLWGGGRFEMRSSMAVGDRISRHGEIAAVEFKRGGSGELLVVTERHVYGHNGKTVAIDEIDIIYRSNKRFHRSGAVTTEPQTSAAVVVTTSSGDLLFRPDPVFLFRFSALTQNAHRIHYDAPYAIGIEGYQNLVVHGPLLALLLLELPRRFRPDRIIRQASMKMRRPAFANDVITVRQSDERNRLMLTADVENRESESLVTGQVVFDD